MKYTFLDYKKMSFSSKLLYLKSKRINIADPYIGYYDNLHRTVEIPSIHKVFGKSSLIINLVPPQPALKNHAELSGYLGIINDPKDERHADMSRAIRKWRADIIFVYDYLENEAVLKKVKISKIVDRRIINQ
jgi:hypothetical protein